MVASPSDEEADIDMDLKEALRSLTIFNQLDEEALEQVAQIARLKTVKKKTVIFHEGAERDAVYFLQDGLVKTYKTDLDGNEHIVSLLQSGDMFPHTGFFSQDPYPATAETLVDSLLIILSLRYFEQLIQDVPSISKSLIDVMGAKINELQFKIQQITGHDVHGRILTFLNQIANKLGERRGDHIHIELPITNQELANSIGTTRETVNRLLNQLKKKQIIRSTRSEIVILDMEALQNWQE